MTRTIFPGLTVFLWLFATSVDAHELWIEPSAYQVASGVSTTADLLNGEAFKGTTVYYNPAETVRLDRLYRGAPLAIAGRLGDDPAIRLPELEDGLHVLIYQSKPSRLTYSKWNKFAKFAAHKDFPDIEARHTKRKLPRDDFREVYTRYSKALIAVGDGKGKDKAVGLDVEIVAQANPYKTTETTLPVRVLYKGAPRGDAQVELFEKAPDGTVAITLHRTDAQGEVWLPIRRGHRYLVDTVVLRVPSAELAAEHDAVWESLWAALTFAVPE